MTDPTHDRPLWNPAMRLLVAAMALMLAACAPASSDPPSELSGSMLNQAAGDGTLEPAGGFEGEGDDPESDELVAAIEPTAIPDDSTDVISDTAATSPDLEQAADSAEPVDDLSVLPPAASDEIDALAAATPSAESETISFPSRSSDLADGRYWSVTEFDEGCCTLDLNIRQWSGTQWVSSAGGVQLDWDSPLYAPASGRIASCWRNFPDDPPGTAQPDNEELIFKGGNHVVIITDAGNAITINHLKFGTIPAELCPSNAGNTQFPSTMTREGSWRIAAYIKPNDRPRVTEGEFIGRVGDSGQSGGAHLHTALSRVTGADTFGREALSSARPMRLRNVWGHRYRSNVNVTPEGWYRFRGGEFSGDSSCDGTSTAESCGYRLIHPSPYLRRTDVSAGAVKDVDVAFLWGDRAVTGVIDGSGNLKLISWDLVGVNKILRKSDISAGAVKSVRLARLSSSDILAAVRLPTDELKLIHYQVTALGSFVRKADASAGKISDLAVAVTGAAPSYKTVTAVKGTNGELKIIVWAVEYANNGTSKVVRLGDASAGAVSAVSISTGGGFSGVVTAVRDGGGNLKVIPWQISKDGKTVTRRADASAGEVWRQISVAPLTAGVAAAVRDASDKLRIITWSTNSNGDLGTRRDTAIAGKITAVAALDAPLAHSNLTTVVRSDVGDLILIGWAIDSNGANVRRLGSTRAGAVSLVAADSAYRSYAGLDGRDMILTAMRDSGGDLKLITWDTNLVNP